MGRRKKEGLVEVLIQLPWHWNIVLGVMTFIVLRWIIPAFFSGNPILAGFAIASRGLAWMALVAFTLIGLIALVRGLDAAAKTVPKGAVPNMLADFGRSPTSASRKLSPEWGRSASHAAYASAKEQAAAKQTPPGADAEFSAWTTDALRALEWKRFELLCARYYEAVGFKSETLRCGADGGIDIKLYKIDPTKPLAIVQCKAWRSPVGVKEIRELFGVMAHEKVGRGIFITTSTYTKDALAFGAANPIQLLDGASFIQKLQELPQHSRVTLFNAAFDGDYRTPTCASCGIKMVRREGKSKAFWGCMNFPRCTNMLEIKKMQVER